MYRVLLERAAEKDLARLFSEIHGRVVAANQGLATNPRPPGCRKLAGSKADWRIRGGDFLESRQCGRTVRTSWLKKA
jgi:mRNA interferase RelE/StbE